MHSHHFTPEGRAAIERAAKQLQAELAARRAERGALVDFAPTEPGTQDLLAQRAARAEVRRFSGEPITAFGGL